MVKWVILFTLVLGLGTFFWVSEHFKQPDRRTAQHGSTWIDDVGKLHVMGLVLNRNTVREAEIILKSRVDTAIFMYPEQVDGNKQREGGEQHFRLELEAYFPSIADHSKVMLVLNIDGKLLEKMRQRGTRPRVYPNGVGRINLANADMLAVQKMTFHELRLIPSVQLDTAMLESRFGRPESIQNDGVSGIHYHYPKVGLDAFIKPADYDVLRFR
ncbi:MAG: hypothetical protein R8K53_01655 [Mariprofundaceae bacterium]